jgi:hypothetical protein
MHKTTSILLLVALCVASAAFSADASAANWKRVSAATCLDSQLENGANPTLTAGIYSNNGSESGSSLTVECAIHSDNALPSYNVSFLSVDVINDAPSGGTNLYPTAIACHIPPDGLLASCGSYANATSSGYSSLSLDVSGWSSYEYDYMFLNVGMGQNDMFFGYYEADAAP